MKRPKLVVVRTTEAERKAEIEKMGRVLAEAALRTIHSKAA